MLPALLAAILPAAAWAKMPGRDSIPVYQGVTAHRGNSAYNPENTLTSFRSALALGVEWVELDIHRTKDGKIVVSHDGNTRRTAGKDFTIARTDYADLKTLDVAADFRRRKGKTLQECPPEHMPLLEEVLPLFTGQQHTHLSIQPKMDCVADAIAIVKKCKAEKLVGFNDSNLKLMSEVKELAPSIPVFWDRLPFGDIDADIVIARQKGFESMVVYYSSLTPENVQKIKTAGIHVGAWTVDDATEMRRLLEMGVERIYTDDPALLMSIKKEPVMDAQAHRGGRALMPENTVAAMINAVKLGARTLEMDCSISADYQALVSHDPYMSADIILKPDGSPVTKEEQKQYILYQMNYDSIRKFDAGTKPHPQFPEQARFKTYKPLLGEVIDSVEVYVKANHLKPVYYNIETKCMPQGDDVYNPRPDVFLFIMMSVIKSKGIEDRVTVQSFDIRTLQALHREMPKQKTALLIMNKDSYEANIARLGFNPTYYSPYFSLVNEQLVATAHHDSVKVLPWTVNEVADIKKMEALGVDGIISDCPDKLVTVFGNYQQP